MKAVNALLLTLAFVGCSSSEPKPAKETYLAFEPVNRQFAPETAYGRIRFSHPPNPVTLGTRPAADRPVLNPVMHLQMKNVSLEAVVQELARSVRYSSYCVSTLAKQRVTIDAIGTFAELIERVREVSGADIVVDETIKSVRVFEARAVTPRLYEGESEHEYQSNHS